MRRDTNEEMHEVGDMLMRREYRRKGNKKNRKKRKSEIKGVSDETQRN